MFTILSCYHAKVKRSKLQTFLHFFPDHFYHLNHQCRHKCQQQNISIHQHSHFCHIKQPLKNRNAKYQSQKNTSTQKCSHAVLVGPKSSPCHGLLAPAVKPMKQACQCQRCKSHRCCKRGTLLQPYIIRSHDRTRNQRSLCHNFPQKRTGQYSGRRIDPDTQS